MCLPRIASFLLFSGLLWANDISSRITSSSSASVSFEGQTAAWITLEGDVDQGMADYTKRAINEAMRTHPDVVVFEINTFGGRLDAAFEIVDTITAIRNAQT
ncbi:MAG TPA: nodulation efficiency protein D (NfeD) family protein, partial [Fibrobacteraceae bacterium]|nr:nodulation efficiency protein D (NfeD) family protein [Fibrobacteraceae bacterium]